jgi:hypothetical protein
MSLKAMQDHLILKLQTALTDTKQYYISLEHLKYPQLFCEFTVAPWSALVRNLVTAG